MKLITRLLALCLTLLTAGLLAFIYMLNAPQGLQWTYRIAEIVLPGKLDIEQLDGRLIGPFTLHGIHYQNATTDLRINRLDLQWQAGALVAGILQIDDLSVDGIQVQQSPSEENSKALPDIGLPLAVYIDQAKLSNLIVAQSGKSGGVILTEVTLANTEFKNGRLQLQQLAVTAPQYRFNVTGNLRPQRNYPLDISIQWTMAGSDFGRLNGEAQISGDLDRLVIKHHLMAPIRATLTGTVSDVLTSPAWRAKLDAPSVDLHRLRDQWPALTLGGSIRANGSLRGFRMDGELHSQYQDLHAVHRFTAAFDHDILKISRLETLLPESNTRIELHGTLSQLRQHPQAVLEGSWQGLRWPLQEESQIHSTTGHFNVTGTLDDYQILVNGDLAGKQLPPGTWSLSAEGTPQQLTITQLRGMLLDGVVAANGSLGWQPRLHWSTAIEGRDLDPGSFWHAWPGRLGFAATGNGEITPDGGLQLQMKLSQLRGELKTVAVDGDGSLRLQGDRIELPELKIDAGGNRFAVTGSVDKVWNLQWQVNTAPSDKSHDQPSTSSPVPSKTRDGDHQSSIIAGHLQGSGDITGPRTSPLFTASLAGRQLNIANRHIDGIDMVMAVDLQHQAPSILELEAHDVNFGDLRLDSIRVRGEGTAQNHQLQSSVISPYGSLSLLLSGDYRQQQWSGTVETLDLETPDTGNWRLDKPAKVALGKAAARLDEVCLRQEKARACGLAQWTAGQGWKARASADAMPLELAKAWLPSGTSLTGNLAAEISAASDADNLITGKADVRLEAGLVPPGTPGNDNKTPAVTYHKAQLLITLDDRTLATRLQADLADGGAMQGSVDIERPALPAPLGLGRTSLDTALLGQLNGEAKDLSLLPALIPGVEHTQGHLFTTLTVTGSLDKPQLIGEVRLENGSASIPALGVNPEAINLVARGDEKGHLHLDAQLRSKGGTLRLGGDMHYDKSHGLNIQAKLNGDKAEIVNTPEFHILASPNLQLTLQGHRIDLNGEIFIPEANLRPRDVSGAVTPSDDVIIVNAEGPPAPVSRWLIYSQLRLRLGDFVKFNGFGLKGLLAGDLTMNDAPQRPTVARGELRINKGEYRAYGQKLAVDRGRLLFFGGPVDNPGLDIRAVRVIQEITAGIMVRGTLKAPQVQIFSEPAMAETDALSYLLIGQPINQATTSEGQQLYGAALSLGLAGSGLLASQIGQRFGIDEVLVESGGTFGGGALVIRHYLSPKLYISYGVGLVERFNIFLMRYQISHSWALEAESGIQSGADLVYTLESN